MGGAAALLATCAISTAALAQNSHTQQAEHAPAVALPSGDFGTPATAANQRPRSAGIPIGRAALNQLKSQPGDSLAQDAVVPKAEPVGIVQTCDVNVGTGFRPSDVHGAASTTRLVNVTNVDIGVYNRTNCAIVSRVPLKTLFAGFSDLGTQTIFDPRVVFDLATARLIVTEESEDSRTNNHDQYQYIAVSTDSTASSWKRVRFTFSKGTAFFCKSGATAFWDYPQLGVSNRRIIITGNNFPNGDPDEDEGDDDNDHNHHGNSPDHVTTAVSNTGAVFSVDKLALINGQSVVGKCFFNRPFNLAPPIVRDSSTNAFVLSPGSGSGSQLRRFVLGTAGTVASDTLTETTPISISAWSAPPGAKQPNGQKLDTLDGRFQSASIQLGSNLWNTHAVNSGGFARTRVYRLSTTGTSALFTRILTTTTCANCDNIFNPSVAINSTATTANEFVTTTRTIPSAAGTTGFAAMLIFRGPNASGSGWVFSNAGTSSTQFTGEGGKSCNTTPKLACRWGDYSATQIDPLNSGRAWGYNQLITGTQGGNWKDRASLMQQ
jgi:hypothetical protein